MPRFQLDPEVAKFMRENDVDESEAANILEKNYDEIWDIVDEDSDDDDDGDYELAILSGLSIPDDYNDDYE